MTGQGEQVFFHFAGCLPEIVRAHDVVAVENRACLVTGNHHGYPLWNTDSHHVPSIRLLERLRTRNEFLIASHYPLCDTLIAQTGASETGRRVFLNARPTEVRASLVHEWEPTEVAEPLF